MNVDVKTGSLGDIRDILMKYFDGLHRADTELLNSIFDDESHLYAPGIRRSKKEWLDLVANRPVPQQLGHAFAYEVLSIEVCGDQAMAKVTCPLLGQNFIDYLGLLLEDGKWRIVAKQYADNPHVSTNNS